jgi:hypothetical protein
VNGGAAAGAFYCGGGAEPESEGGDPEFPDESDPDPLELCVPPLPLGGGDEGCVSVGGGGDGCVSVGGGGEGCVSVGGGGGGGWLWLAGGGGGG